MSLKELSAWCTDRFGSRNVRQDLARATSSAGVRPRLAMTEWAWSPRADSDGILEEIAVHAEANPSWFDLTYD